MSGALAELRQQMGMQEAASAEDGSDPGECFVELGLVECMRPRRPRMFPTLKVLLLIGWSLCCLHVCLLLLFACLSSAVVCMSVFCCCLHVCLLLLFACLSSASAVALMLFACLSSGLSH